MAAAINNSAFALNLLQIRKTLGIYSNVQKPEAFSDKAARVKLHSYTAIP